MINTLKKAKIIMFHESGIGYAVVEHKLIPFEFEKMEVEEVKYVFENGKQVKYKNDITWQTEGELFEYTIHNGYDYELAENSDIYSKFFFTPEEFKMMCDKALKELIDEGHKYPDVYSIATRVEENHPGTFTQLNLGCGWSIPRED